MDSVEHIVLVFKPFLHPCRSNPDLPIFGSSERMGVATFSEVLDQMQVLDVRPELQFNAAHIPGKEACASKEILFPCPSSRKFQPAKESNTKRSLPFSSHA